MFSPISQLFHLEDLRLATREGTYFVEQEAKYLFIFSHGDIDDGVL